MPVIDGFPAQTASNMEGAPVPYAIQDQITP